MKIVQLIYSLTGGGAERFTVDLANELAKTCDVYLLLIVRKDIPGASFYLNEVSDKVHLINLGLNKGLTWKAFFKVYNAIKKIKPDIINAHLNTLIYLFPLVYLCPRIKYFHTLHNPAEICTGIKGQDIFNRFFYRKHIKPITISDLSNKSYITYYKNNNSIQIDNGRSKPQTTNMLNSVKDEIESYKLHKDDIIFIHVARCHPQKNQMMLMNVFNRLLNENKHLILLMCGGGFETQLGQEIKRTASKGIYFLGAKQNIADYLSTSNCFVLSSKWEGLPISLLEAMSYGVTPILTPVGGIPSVIKNGENGILSDDVSEESLYNAIISYLDKTIIIDKNKVTETFEKEFSMKLCAQRYLEVYNQSIKQ